VVQWSLENPKDKHEVKKWRKSEKGCGNKLNQQETVYVSDWSNHRVMNVSHFNFLSWQP